MKTLSILVFGVLYFAGINAFMNCMFDYLNQEYLNNIFLLMLVADIECGVARIRNGKIVNGVDAAEGEFPW